MVVKGIKFNKEVVNSMPKKDFVKQFKDRFENAGEIYDELKKGLGVAEDKSDTEKV